MSATNRGAQRREADFYGTPRAAFERLVPYIRFGPVWEPAAGDRRLILMMAAHGIEADGNDLIDGYDFLKDPTPRAAIVTNPPFSLALEFANHALSVAPHVLLLLRLNFLASRKRRDWWIVHNPSALFVLSDRPSFTGDGQTDATDYAWFYWGTEYRGFCFL